MPVLPFGSQRKSEGHKAELSPWLFPSLTQLVFYLHSQVVGIHNDSVLRGCLHWSHHYEDEGMWVREGHPPLLSHKAREDWS